MCATPSSSSTSPIHWHEAEEPKTVKYFAFGSNMSREKMRERLGAGWVEFSTKRAILHGWAMSCHVRGLYLVEKAFAGILKVCDELTPCIRTEEAPRDAISPVCGVVYEMRVEDFKVLWITEGPMYDLHDVDVQCLQSGRRITCKAFVCREGYRVGEDIHCSKRYRDILVKGVRESGLPSWYADKVENKIPFEHASPLFQRFSVYLARFLLLGFRLSADLAKIGFWSKQEQTSNFNLEGAKRQQQAQEGAMEEEMPKRLTFPPDEKNQNNQMKNAYHRMARRRSHAACERLS